MFEEEIVAPDGRGIIKWIGNDTEIVLTVPRETGVYFFQNYAIKYGDIVGSQLGLYQTATIGNDRKAKFLQLNTPSFLIQPRGKGCTWTPSGVITGDSNEIESYPWMTQMETCPDTWWNSCLEKLLGTGNDVNDMFSTPEGQALFNEMIRQVYTGLGNSYYMLANFGRNSLIDDAESAGSWASKVDAETWQRFKLNNSIGSGGFYTIADDLQEDGLPHFNVPIENSELSYDKKLYTGDAKAFVDKLISHCTYDFAQVNEQHVYEGMFPVIKLSYSIFNRLQEQNKVSSFAETNPTATNYYFTGSDKTFRLGPSTMLYNGYYIIKDHAQQRFDSILNAVTHRGMLVLNGNFGVGHDTENLAQYGGLGLRLFQDLRPKEGGKIYMDAKGRISTHILNTDFMTHGSRSFLFTE